MSSPTGQNGPPEDQPGQQQQQQPPSSPPPPSVAVVSPSSPTRPQRVDDDDGIHLAPEPGGGGTPVPAAAERRLSFVQMEGRARSRSVGEKQWTRVRAVMAWYTRLRRIKKSVVVSCYPLVRRHRRLSLDGRRFPLRYTLPVLYIKHELARNGLRKLNIIILLLSFRTPKLRALPLRNPHSQLFIYWSNSLT